ncbi:hypothetical protein BU25DRAFT_408991 [Macroventuria anomochaeta]|uniref:Uncharacterized protein n=1 Tax=Macroventuria anomochaeta TaxID=301207 RepID=A0ACB6S931_9PLEO|nr:uncharacterized protein BU25DRAFT_408991 [Macroventuria anomochaeta]KAF2629724.1 hypothetical protein BU25DRAFT_408991 [Macroventuria anomochaeta]
MSLGSNTSTVEDAPTTDTVMTSIETLPPNTSQTSANSGASKRILSRGQQVVLNSDSDSDSMGELDFGLPAPKLKIPTYTSRSTRRTGFDEPQLRRPPKAGRHSGKRSFTQLMETAQKNLDTERKIQERKAALEKEDEQPAPVATTLDKSTLKHAIQDGDDSDQADRLYKAMRRTNGVQAQTAYHFFEDTPDLSSIPSFPQRSLPDHGWTACFEEPSTRDQAFMTGFAHQIFRLQELPKELATWMLDQICLGRNAALDQKYLEILQTHDEQLQKQLSPRKLDAMFKSIGAQVESLDANSELSPSEAQANNHRPLPPSLKRIAALLTSAAPWLHAKARIHAFHLLCHTCLDDRVLLDPEALRLVQDAIEAVICQYANNHKLTSGVGSPPPDDLHSLITSQLTYVIPKLLSRVTNPLLQANLVHAFPTESPLTAYLQRHLALSFLFHPAPVDVPLADPQLPRLIHTYLELSLHWRMSKDTNYSFVAARLALLDIAIGPGPLTVPYLPLISPPPSEAGSPPPVAPTPASSEVKEFNREVDALAQHVKLLGNSIVETGAALDLTILEAKERCERVFWRLQHAVRIGGKKADNVFGGGEDEKQLKVKKFFRALPAERPYL